MREAVEALRKMAEAFDELSKVCKLLDLDSQAQLFNAVTFGPISEFLGLGNTYERELPGYRFTSVKKLLILLHANVDYLEELNFEAEEGPG